LPAETDKPLPPDSLEWAGRIWKQLSVFECAGVLYIALRYDHQTPHTGAYIETMSMLPWLGLGAPLQQDVTRTFIRLRSYFGRGF